VVVVLANPKTVSGFGPVKAEKYGDDILRIVKKYGVNHGSVQ